jgi:hypothetical protein
MKRTLLIATLIVGACAVAPAQDVRTGARAEGHGSASVKQGDRLELASGTRLAAQLQQTLDVRKARVGDEVVLKMTEAVKSNGQTVVKRGAKLVGRVTEVQQRASGQAASRIGLVFDRLESGSLASPISVTIAAVTQTSARAGSDDLGADAGGSASASGGTSQGGSQGGLLGGVGSTVGGVAGATTGAVGQTVGTAAGAVGGVANGVGSTVRGLRIEQTAGAEVSGSSTLSLAGGNLRLEKNTTFHLVVQESAGVNQNR